MDPRADENAGGRVQGGRRWPVRAGLRDLLAAALVFALAWLALGSELTRPDEDGLYGDETCWVAISIQHWSQLAHGAPAAGAELDPPRWRGGSPWARGVQRTAFGYPSPCLAKLVWGPLLHARGFRQASPLVYPVFLQHDVEGGRAAREALEPALPIARRVVLACACLTTVLLCLAARAALPGGWGWLGAALTLALWLSSPIVRATAVDVRTDFFMLVFVLGAVVLALRARDALAGRRGVAALWLAGIGLGLCCGLAVSSKLNGALSCLCVAVWIPLMWSSARRQQDCGGMRVPLVALALSGALTCLVFWALNPRLWAEPLAGVADILARWRELFASFQGDWAQRSGTAVGRTPSESAALFLDRTFSRDDPWRALTGLGGGAGGMVGGLCALAWRALHRGAGPDRSRSNEPALVLLVFVLVMLVGSALWLPIDWPRYFLPAAPCLALLEALALVTLLQVVVRRLRPPPAN